MLTGISGLDRQDIKRAWRKIHKEKLHNLYYLTKYYQRDPIEFNEMGWDI